MMVKPVRKYKVPTYPTRIEALVDPSLLEKYIPSAWRRNSLLMGSVAVFLAANAFILNCKNTNPNSAKGKAAVVAPIFVHGEGRGAVGCVVVNPPIFLSEADALQVIKEELNNAGINLAEKNVVIKDITIPSYEKDYSSDKENIRKIPGGEKPLKVDFFDREKKLAIEYVSISDYFENGGAYSNSTVQDYDFATVAESLRTASREKGEDINMGIFYDPAVSVDNELLQERTDWEKQWEEKREKGITEARMLLREQVTDFIGWLKGQGVI